MTGLDWVRWALPIFLAIPVGILTNMLTPRIARWWSELNTKRMTTRLASLDDLLRKMQDDQYTFRSTLSKALYGAFETALLAFCTIGLVCVDIRYHLFALMYGVHPLPFNRGESEIVYWSVIASLFYVGWSSWKAVTQVRLLNPDRQSKHRDAIQNEITTLTQKLAKCQQP